MAKKKTTKKRKKKPAVKPEPAREKNAEPNPEFEQGLKTIAGEQPEAEKKNGRGGIRPGAGRPRGVSDDFAAVNRLPEKANLTLVPVLQIPFELWAQSQGLPELALKKNEAEDLALPVTRLLEFYFPDKIPEIAWVWLMMLGATYNVVSPRLKLLAEKRKEKIAPASSLKPTGKGVGSGPSPRPHTGGGPAQPAEGYPRENA